MTTEAFRHLSSWFENQNYSSEEDDQARATDLDPDTMKLDRPLTIQQVVIMLNYYLNNDTFMHSKHMLNRFEIIINKSYEHIAKDNTLFGIVRTIVTKLVYIFHQLIVNKELISSLMNIFQEVAYRKMQENSQYRDLYYQLDIEKYIEVLKEEISQAYHQGIKKRKTEKNRKMRLKRNSKLQRERSQVNQQIPELVLPVKRRNAEVGDEEESEGDTLVVKSYGTELPLEWEIQANFVNEIENTQLEIQKLKEKQQEEEVEFNEEENNEEEYNEEEEFSEEEFSEGEVEVEKWYFVKDEERENDVLVPESKTLTRFEF